MTRHPFQRLNPSATCRYAPNEAIRIGARVGLRGIFDERVNVIVDEPKPTAQGLTRNRIGVVEKECSCRRRSQGVNHHMWRLRPGTGQEIRGTPYELRKSGAG